MNTNGVLFEKPRNDGGLARVRMVPMFERPAHIIIERLNKDGEVTSEQGFYAEELEELIRAIAYATAKVVRFCGE